MFGSELPADRRKLWELLDRFVARWFPAWPGEPGVAGAELDLAEQRLGRALPVALREWYQRIGARRDVWSQQDRFLMPDELRVERDVLIFCDENQSVVQWGIRLDDLTRDDPPVVISDADGGKAWFVESVRTSAFALHDAVLNAKWSAAHSANGQGTEEARSLIDYNYPRLPFPETHWPWPTRVYGRDDILVETQGDDWIWASARSEQALAELDALVRKTGMTWELYEGQ